MGQEDEIQRQVKENRSAAEAVEREKQEWATNRKRSFQHKMSLLEPHAHEYIKVLKDYNIRKTPIYQYFSPPSLFALFANYQYKSRKMGNGWRIHEDLMLDDLGRFWLKKQIHYKVRTAGPGGRVSYHRLSSNDVNEWDMGERNMTEMTPPSLEDVNSYIAGVISENLNK
ncbi:hypothetical protein [Kocuria rosea]|uniref:hypothetical protein n=1 Tax=Kocuria rosea TaxID=1275 RepID=UPI0025B75582|nr:hypothetical protein [Kocuria rosea]WJZ68349.1 hypothetical protein QR564_18020 [Kocuria rosea]